AAATVAAVAAGGRHRSGEDVGMYGVRCDVVEAEVRGAGAAGSSGCGAAVAAIAARRQLVELEITAMRGPAHRVGRRTRGAIAAGRAASAIAAHATGLFGDRVRVEAVGACRSAADRATGTAAGSGTGAASASAADITGIGIGASAGRRQAERSALRAGR